MLGVVQGLTEFLPISSSAHLILARAFFGWDGEFFGLGFDIAVHVGTLGAVLYYFRSDLPSLIAAAPAALAGGGRETGQLVRAIAIGTVPIIMLGLLAAGAIEERLRTPAVCAAALVIGGIALVVAERIGKGNRAVANVSLLGAFAIGCGQAMALVPGMSRSGSAIAVAMFLGLGRVAGARFAFLLSIPAILAAAGYHLVSVRGEAVAVGALGVYVVGAATSGVVGYLAIKYFMRYLERHSLDVFAYYRFALAACAVAWLTLA